MVTLLIKIMDICNDPISNSFDWYEILGVGSIYEKISKHVIARDIYNNCIYTKDKYIRIEAYKRLVNIYRKDKDYKNMGKCLNSIVEISDLPTINILIDLSKYYEHKIKDYKMALQIIDRAIADVVKFNAMRNKYLKDLKHRRDRVIKKIDIRHNQKIN